MDADRKDFEAKCDAYARSQITWGDLRAWLTSAFADLAHRAAQPAGVEDAERMEWLERMNPIIFHKSWEGDEWEVVPFPNAEQSPSFTGATLREAIDAASKGEAA